VVDSFIVARDVIVDATPVEHIFKEKIGGVETNQLEPSKLLQLTCMSRKN
jgi:hypothetical protein